MSKKTNSQVKKVLLCFTMFFFLTENAFTKPKSNLVKEEAGYYYGYGNASEKEDATFAAKKDLVEKALTATLRIIDPKAEKITVSDDIVSARIGTDKSFYETKDGKSVVYRMKVSEWEKRDKVYSEQIRKNLTDAFNTASTKGDIAVRLKKASYILTTLADNGIYDLLTLQEKSTDLYSRKVENICKNLISNIVFTVDCNDSIISPNTQITVTAKDTSDNIISNLKLKASWSVPYLPISLEKEELPEVVSILTTDTNGNIVIDYPMDEEYQNTALELTLSTTISLVDRATKGMRQIDGESSIDCRYYCVDDINEIFTVVEIAAGDYVTGKISSDVRATEKEASRKVKLNSYSIGINPVTNEQYAIYLYLTRNDLTPEYFYNSDYNDSDCPIIGVNLENAQNFCTWLSEQTESTYRLPTDDEWEVAARADNEVIYTWGNEDPSKGKKANYKGNGKFKTISPVGSFDIGNNTWGIADMCGNVWEWTTSTRNADEKSQIRTVKGGSWMDGPVDLRISNFKNIDMTNGYPDVGFRLVKEASK